LLFLFRKDLGETTVMSLELDHTRAINDPERLRITLYAMGLIVILFFIHHTLHINASFAAFIGLSIALLLLQPKPEELFGNINWSVLVFFSGLFVIVGGVESSGLLHLFGNRLAVLATEPGMLLIACLLLMWVSAVLSAMVDNIPFTLTMIPIILGLDSQGAHVAPLWWALALGVGLGGNATHIGATANLIVIAESEQCGISQARITPWVWMQHGIPATLSSLVVASLLFTLFFEFFN
jgi:Na+/H+ antiporter NhaD/arsenite permease-like protein